MENGTCSCCKYKTVSHKKNPCKKCIHSAGANSSISYYEEKIPKKKIFTIKPIIKDKVVEEREHEGCCYSCANQRKPECPNVENIRLLCRRGKISFGNPSPNSWQDCATRNCCECSDWQPKIKPEPVKKVEKKSELMQIQCFMCVDYHYYQRYGYCLGCANNSKYRPKPCIPEVKPETDAYGHGIPKEFLDFGAMVIIEDGDNNPANGIITERLTSKNGVMAIHLEGQDETRLFSLKNITKIMLITKKKVFSVTKKGNNSNGN